MPSTTRSVVGHIQTPQALSSALNEPALFIQPCQLNPVRGINIILGIIQLMACSKSVSDRRAGVVATSLVDLRSSLNDGNQVPWMAFGTGTSLRQKNAQNPVENAIANGFTHIDGAQMYENEESLGVAIRASGTPRSALFVTTKLDRLQPDQTAKTALQVSLKKLGLEYVDLYLVHVPGHHAGRLKEVWKMMEECKRERLAKSIGVSNFEVAHLQEILEGAEFPPSVNQVS